MTNLIGMFILFIFSSCGNSVEFKESPISNFEGTFPVSALTFKNIYNQVLKSNCVQCHARYSDYETVFSEKESILDVVLKGRMPKNAPALNEDLIGLLSQWVKNGAPFGDSNTSPTPTKLTATWDSLSKKVIFPKCVQCHNPSGQASFLDLSTRQSFFNQKDDLLNDFEDVENSYLIEVITDVDEPMPPSYSNIERLNKDEIKTLIEWIEKGLP